MLPNAIMEIVRHAGVKFLECACQDVDVVGLRHCLDVECNGKNNDKGNSNDKCGGSSLRSE